MTRIGCQVAVAVLAIAPAAMGATWTVCSSGCDFTDLETAVAAAASNDVIELGVGVHVGSVTIDRSLAVRGVGAARTSLQGTVTVAAGAVVTVADLTLENPARTAQGLVVEDGADLSVQRATLRDHEVPGARGGAALQVEGTALLDRCLVTGNDSGTNWDEGVLHVDRDGQLTIVDTVIRDNTGQAILSRGTLRLDRTTVHRNRGGTPILASGRNVLLNTTVTDNEDGQAAVSLAFSVESTVRNCTIAHNRQLSFSYGNGLNAENAWVVMSNTILAHNTGSPYSGDCIGMVHSEGHNIIGEDYNCELQGDPTSLFGVDPLLLPLAGNGGATPTLGLDPASPAVDAGSPDPVGFATPACSPFDQRRFPRPIDGDGDLTDRCDIGAFELQRVVPCGEPSEVDRQSSFEPLRVRKETPTGLRLDWQQRDTLGDNVYQGSLAGLSAGAYDHVMVECRVAGSATTVAPPADDAYFLLAAHCPSGETSYGRDSFGDERPAAAMPCP